MSPFLEVMRELIVSHCVTILLVCTCYSVRLRGVRGPWPTLLASLSLYAWGLAETFHSYRSFFSLGHDTVYRPLIVFEAARVIVSVFLISCFMMHCDLIAEARDGERSRAFAAIVNQRVIVAAVSCDWILRLAWSGSW